MKSKERANVIIAHHIENIKKAHGILKAVILVGSLSNDSYTGNAGSDIDLIHVLNDNASPDSKNIVCDLIAKTEDETNRDIPISKCVYFYSDLFPPYKTDFDLNDQNKDMLELPIEIFRIKESGKIIYGNLDINEIPMPENNDVLTFHEISKRWNKSIAEQDPERYKMFLRTAATPPINIIAQSVLTGAMTHYYFRTNESCSNKAQIYDKIKTSIPDYRFLKLLELSYKWRYYPDCVTDDEKAFMTSEYKLWYETRRNNTFDI